MKVRLVVILAIAMVACSERSFARPRQPADVKSQADAAASSSKHATGVVYARSPRDDRTVILDLSFSSIEIDPSFAEYLSLTSSQITAVQRLVSQERREVEPLKAQLQSIHRKLLAASDRGQPTETEAFAATEGRILTKLIIKNSRTQATLHGLLTHEQRKKLEELEILLNKR